MKPLLIGEAPSKNEVTEHPLEGRVGKRLALVCGLTLSEFLNHFDRVNLLHERQDTKEKGFEFNADVAHYEALVLASRFVPGQLVLLLGHRVAKAFCVKPMYFEQQDAMGMGAETRVLPHPSGINRWWNQPLNMRHAEEFMRNIVERTR